MKLRLITAAIASTVFAFGAFAQSASDSDKEDQSAAGSSDEASSQSSQPSQVPAATGGSDNVQGNDSPQPSGAAGAPPAGMSPD